MGLTIKELLQIATNRLIQTGASTPKLDAEVLLGEMLKESRTFLITHCTDSLSDGRCENYFQLIDRRSSGEPVQYITNKQEFMGMQFYVDENVLIPRPDTETMVEYALKLLDGRKSINPNPSVLDLCCGSGAIAVSLSYYLPKIKATASDISSKALEISKKNAKDYRLDKKINFIEGNLFDPLRKKKPKFDMILSNPPYISTDIIPTLQREVREHEPLLALDGGEDGLSYYRIIIKESPDFMRRNGVLLLEIGYDQGEELISLISADNRYKSAEIIKDLSGNDRVVFAQLY